MLSRDRIRNEPENVAELLASRGVDGGVVERWQELDAGRRREIAAAEELRRRRNEASSEIGRLKREGDDESAAEQIRRVGDLKGEIERREAALAAVEERLAELEQGLPNLPHQTVPVGPDESANREEKRVGEPPSFDFAPRAHWDLGPALGILDFERGAKVAGARFTVGSGAGARLERALINLMLDLHTGEHGYREMLPPFVVNATALFGTGQLPKFARDLFRLEGTDHYLVPTAEVPLTNLHAGEILDGDDLPLRYAAWTACFRSEAGSYGKDVRGLIRQHQFNKVELVQLVHPETSDDALEELTRHAERVLELLELPYRRVTLSTGDMGFAAAKTYDLEVWLPGQDAYREISSCSNCEAFQARRADLRFRPAAGGRPRLVHTLNGSGLAVGRTLVAILENCQREDGSVAVPEALRGYMGGLETIVPGA